MATRTVCIGLLLLAPPAAHAQRRPPARFQEPQRVVGRALDAGARRALPADSVRAYPAILPVTGAILGAIAGAELGYRVGKPFHVDCTGDFCPVDGFWGGVVGMPIGVGLGTWLLDGRRGSAAKDVGAATAALVLGTAVAAGSGQIFLLPLGVIAQIPAAVVAERSAARARTHPRPAAPPSPGDSLPATPADTSRGARPPS